MLDRKLINIGNGAQVLIVSDPKANKTSCAVDVRTGSMNDPVKCQGLSHLVEHMMFQGSTRHPDVNELSAIMYSNQGIYTAATGPEHSSFSFEVANAAFKQSLNIFSGFFYEPLFREQDIKGEIALIDSEFCMNKKDPDQFCRHIMNTEAVVKGHPISKFFHGSSKSLKGVTASQVREFFFRYYSPSSTKIAVCSRLSLAELEEQLLIAFSPVKDNGHGWTKFNGPVFNAKELPDVLHVEYKGGRPFLRVCFETPSMYGFFRSKPNWVLSTLLNSEREGSVISILREQGLAEELWSSFQTMSFVSFVNIDIRLTHKGLHHSEKVLDVLYIYLELIRKEGYRDYIYEEQKATAHAGLKFKEHKEGYLYVRGLARNMHYYEPVNCEEQSELIYEYDKIGFDNILGLLRPELSRTIIYGAEHKFKQKDKHYGIRFSRSTMKDGLVGKGTYDLKYPSPNLFISTDFEHVKDDGVHFPRKIMDDDNGVVWFLQDWELGLPYLYINLTLLSNVVNAGPKQKLLSILYCKMLNELLMDVSDMAGEAGLSFGLDRSDKGINIYVAGYSEKVPVLFKELMSILKERIDNSGLLEKVRKTLKRDYVELERSGSYPLAQYYKYDLMHVGNINYLEYRDLLDEVSSQDIEALRVGLLSELAIESYVYGNISSDETLLLMKSVHSELGAATILKEARPKDHIAMLPRGSSYSYIVKSKADDSSWASYYDFGKRHIRLSAVVQLGFGFLKGYFFDQMRNKRKLAYIVESRLDFFEHVLGISFVVCSDRNSSVKIANEAQNVFKSFIPYLDSVPDEELLSAKTSLIAGISKYNRTIEEWMSELVLTAAVKGDPDYGKKLCAEISTVSKEELCAIFDSCLIGEQKAVLNVYADGKIDKRNIKRISDVIIEDISAYKASIPSYQ